MHIRRPLAITALLLALSVSVAACGNAEPEAGAAPESPSGVRTLGTGPDPTDEVCGATEPATGPTEITHASGTTEVPADAQRIVLLDSDKFDTLCALGLADKVVGAVELDGGMPKYLGPTIAALPTVGTIKEPALETIASLKPDLILGSKFRTPDLYDQLSQIAPTVFTELVGLTWKENFLLDGQALRRGAQAETLLKDYESKAAEVGSTVDGDTANVSITRFMNGVIRTYGPTSFSGQVLEDAGISRPEFQRLENEEDRRFAEISPEEINLADGDTIYVTAYGPDSDTERLQAMEGPLWKTLSGVKAGRVFVVPDETWMTGIGVVAAGRILDDLKESLTR